MVEEFRRFLEELSIQKCKNKKCCVEVNWFETKSFCCSDCVKYVQTCNECNHLFFFELFTRKFCDTCVYNKINHYHCNEDEKIATHSSLTVVEEMNREMLSFNIELVCDPLYTLNERQTKFLETVGFKLLGGFYKRHSRSRRICI